MKCEDVRKNINRFLNDEMYIKELKDFVRHVESCKECYEELEVNYLVRYTAVALENDDSITYDFTKIIPRVLAKKKKLIKKQETRIVVILLIIIIGAALFGVYFAFLKDILPDLLVKFQAWFQSILR